MKIKDLDSEAQNGLNRTMSLRYNEDIEKFIEAEVEELRADGIPDSKGRAIVMRQLIWNGKKAKEVIKRRQVQTSSK